MKKADKESITIARHIHTFLREYVPSQEESQRTHPQVV